MKLPGFSCQRGFLQFQKIPLCITERPNERIPRFLQFQIVRIRALWLCFTVFLHSSAAFEQLPCAAENGFCQLPQLFQRVEGAFLLLLQFLFHAVTSRRGLDALSRKVKDRCVFLRRAGENA